MSKDADPRSTHLKDYQSPKYQTIETRLSFDIHDGTTEVRNDLTLQRDPHAPGDAPLVLDGQDLELVSITLDGETLSGSSGCQGCPFANLIVHGVTPVT